MERALFLCIQYSQFKLYSNREIVTKIGYEICTVVRMKMINSGRHGHVHGEQHTKCPYNTSLSPSLPPSHLQCSINPSAMSMDPYSIVNYNYFIRLPPFAIIRNHVRNHTPNVCSFAVSLSLNCKELC